jgi:hypothetical protein
MDKEKNEFWETFKNLDQENQADILAHIRFAYVAQENTKRHYGIPDREPTTQAGKTA